MRLAQRLICIAVWGVLTTTQAQGNCGKIVWGSATYDLLIQSPFKPVDRSLVRHPVEKRGFVTVPIDYAHPDGMKIDIFYRLIPVAGFSPDDPTHPIVVVVNGGPGLPSSVYRRMAFDYGDRRQVSEADARDRILNLEKQYRVLLIDQRGTDGLSAPLDLDNASILPEVIAKYFDSDEVARDHERVINQVIPSGEAFYMIQQSYGGQVGIKYLQLASRMPRGMIFASSALPFNDPFQMHLQRRQSQHDLQLHLKKLYPDIADKLRQLRARLSAMSLDPMLVHRLWRLVGWGEDWEAKFVARVDQLLVDDEEVKKFTSAEDTGVSLLNYVLSSACLNEGYTDRTMPLAAQRALPHASWMVDEDWTLMQIGNDGTWREEWVQRVDDTPPPGIDFGTPQSVQALLRKTNVLFTVGVGDSMMAPLTSMDSIERLRDPQDPARILSVNIPGGHPAIFTQAGVATLKRWIESIR